MPNIATPAEVLDLAQRRDHEVQEVAGPRLFEQPGAHRDLRLVDDVPQHDARRAGSPTPSRPGSRRSCRRTRRANRTAPRRRAATATRRTAGAGCARARTRAGARSRASAATTSRAWSSASSVVRRGRRLMGDRSVGRRSARARSARWRNTPARSPWPYVGRDGLGRAVGDDAAVRQEHDALAHLLDVAHVVTRHQQRGAVAVAEVEQTGAHALRDVGVERRGRLVEHEQARPVQRGAHDADERALPRRQLGSHRAGEVGDAEAFETLVDERVRIGDAVELSVEAQVLAHAHALGEREVARREARRTPRPGCAGARGRSRRSSPRPRRARRRRGSSAASWSCPRRSDRAARRAHPRARRGRHRRPRGRGGSP